MEALSEDQLPYPAPLLQLPQPPDPSLVCPYCVTFTSFDKISKLKYHLRAKHATDHDTRIQHHFSPSCQAVSCCTFCFQLFPTTKGRAIHKKGFVQASSVRNREEISIPSKEQTTKIRSLPVHRKQIFYLHLTLLWETIRSALLQMILFHQVGCSTRKLQTRKTFDQLPFKFFSLHHLQDYQWLPLTPRALRHPYDHIVHLLAHADAQQGLAHEHNCHALRLHRSKPGNAFSLPCGLAKRGTRGRNEDLRLDPRDRGVWLT